MKKVALMAPLLCLLLHSAVLWAQPFTLDKKFKATELILHKFTPPDEPKASGRISIAEVTQKDDALYYFVKGASIYSPVYVGLQSTGLKKESISVSLHKLSWKKADRGGITDATGHWEEKFKTENDFGIRVTAKNKPATYSLMVWVGDSPKIELPSVFKKSDAKRK
jgi:hypothetical protein